MTDFFSADPDKYRNRYNILAKKMRKSTKEIITAAKEFQDVMDIEHQNGRFQEPCDMWTVSVFGSNFLS